MRAVRGPRRRLRRRDAALPVEDVRRVSAVARANIVARNARIVRRGGALRFSSSSIRCALAQAERLCRFRRPQLARRGGEKRLCARRGVDALRSAPRFARSAQAGAAVDGERC